MVVVDLNVADTGVCMTASHASGDTDNENGIISTMKMKELSQHQKAVEAAVFMSCMLIRISSANPCGCHHPWVVAMLVNS